MINTLDKLVVDGITSERSYSWLNDCMNVYVSPIYSIKDDTEYCDYNSCSLCKNLRSDNYWNNVSLSHIQAMREFGVEWDPEIRF